MSPTRPRRTTAAGYTGAIERLPGPRGGGVERARQVAEAVRACGGAEAFGTYLELVAGIRAGGAG